MRDTKGATIWVTTLVDNGKAYKVVFPEWGGFNPGYRLAKNTFLSGITHDYRNTLHFLENLEPDIWGGYHCEYFDLEGKGGELPPKALMHGSILKGIAGLLPVNGARLRTK